MTTHDRIERQLNRVIPARLQARWGDIKDGLWFLRIRGTIICAILAFALVKLDTSLTLGNQADCGRCGDGFFTGGLSPE